MTNGKLFRAFRIIAGTLFLTGSVLTFAGGAVFLSRLFKAQAGPVLMRCFGAFTWGAAVVCAVILLSAFLFGRIYCAVFCPFGLLQDLVSFISRRKAARTNDFNILRNAVSGCVLGMLFCGVNAGFLALDPYSNFGRITGSFTLGGLAVLIVISALAVWKRRIFCTTLCPVGTVLGLFSKAGAVRLFLGGNCLKCGKCEKVCPAGCIDAKSGVIDNGRCVRCMNCLAACPVGAVSFAVGYKTAPPDISRRRFLVSGSVLLAGVAAGVLAARTGLLRVGRRLRVLPPGAGSAERFARKCTACMLCAVNCPQKIIRPAPGGAGPVELDLNKAPCRWDCARCAQVCPTGALPFLALAEKRRIRIAEAKFDPRNCLAFQEGAKCGLCASACPAGAITLRKNGTPRPVKTALCVGCGACRKVCPAPRKAMTVSPVEKQSRIE